ncbi:hypothetical protein BDR05DRAFT_955883 [Suillus weaverae]|nr:hypothetical protein BDR05DRAFT_955883 [Suillus weaverae]
MGGFMRYVDEEPCLTLRPDYFLDLIRKDWIDALTLTANSSSPAPSTHRNHPAQNWDTGSSLPLNCRTEVPISSSSHADRDRCPPFAACECVDSPLKSLSVVRST